MADRKMIEKEFTSLEEKIGRLWEAEHKLNSLEIPAKYDSRVASIKSKIKDPERVGEVEKDLEELQNLLELEGQSTSPGPGITPHRIVTSLVPEIAELYEDISLIGSGGFARVFCVKRKSDGAVIAIKVPITIDNATNESFVREITSWNNLKHRNIVKLLKINVMPSAYFEMELCDGNLDSVDKPLGIEQSLHFIYEISSGLIHAHSKGIVHRDLKPHNILLKDGVAKISDWGLSKVSSASRTSTTSSFTPSYAAPEQLSTDSKIDERTDIYQLGVILYELVTGELPFKGETLPQLFNQILNTEPVRPSELKRDTASIEPIILKCMNKDMEKRYRNVEELQRELTGLMKTEFQESLKQSQGNIRRTNFLSGELCILCLQTGDITGALKYAASLQHYTTGETKDKLSELISGLEYRNKEGMEIPEEMIEEAIKVVHQVRMGH